MTSLEEKKLSGEKKRKCRNKRYERPCWGRERQYLNLVSDAVIHGFLLAIPGMKGQVSAGDEERKEMGRIGRRG